MKELLAENNIEFGDIITSSDRMCGLGMKLHMGKLLKKQQLRIKYFKQLHDILKKL